MTATAVDLPSLRITDLARDTVPTVCARSLSSTALSITRD